MTTPANIYAKTLYLNGDPDFGGDTPANNANIGNANGSIEAPVRYWWEVPAGVSQVTLTNFTHIIGSAVTPPVLSQYSNLSPLANGVVVQTYDPDADTWTDVLGVSGIATLGIRNLIQWVPLTINLLANAGTAYATVRWPSPDLTLKTGQRVGLAVQDNMTGLNRTVSTYIIARNPS